MRACHLRLVGLLGLVGLLATAACGAPIDADNAGDATDTNDPAGDVAAAAARATLRFRSDWTVAQQGALVAGSTFQVQYDPARLPGCRGGLNNGAPAWTITGYYSLAGAAPRSFYVAGFSPTGSTAAPALPLASGGDLAVWFQVTNRWGCAAYDSNFGRNFHFAVKPR